MSVRYGRRAACPFPSLDPEQKLATALCAEVAHAPPHVFDAEGRLRYAGEFADGWMEPAKIKRVYLVEALERVLAKQYAANGAVFYNSPPCDCSAPTCKCPKCRCGGPCRCNCHRRGLRQGVLAARGAASVRPVDWHFYLSLRRTYARVRTACHIRSQNGGCFLQIIAAKSSAWRCCNDGRRRCGPTQLV